MDKEEIVKVLMQRLKDCQRNALTGSPINDEFELGIDCRIVNEIWWLENLLINIQK